MHRLACYAILIPLIACTPFRPGQGITPEAARDYGCDYESLVDHADTLTTRLSGESYQYIPQVGWDACELLAHNGTPTRVEHQETAEGQRYMSWWYQAEDETHLVSLVWQPTEGKVSSWIVNYVGW